MFSDKDPERNILLIGKQKALRKWFGMGAELGPSLLELSLHPSRFGEPKVDGSRGNVVETVDDKENGVGKVVVVRKGLAERILSKNNVKNSKKKTMSRRNVPYRAIYKPTQPLDSQ